jgi:hypothetical protein
MAPHTVTDAHRVLGFVHVAASHGQHGVIFVALPHEPEHEVGGGDAVCSAEARASGQEPSR